MLAFCRGQIPARPQDFSSVFSCSQSGAGMAEKEEEELSGHTGRAHQASTGQKFILSMQSLKVVLARERSLPVPASVSFAAHYLRP